MTKIIWQQKNLEKWRIMPTSFIRNIFLWGSSLLGIFTNILVHLVHKLKKILSLFSQWTAGFIVMWVSDEVLAILSFRFVQDYSTQYGNRVLFFMHFFHVYYWPLDSLEASFQGRCICKFEKYSSLFLFRPHNSTIWNTILQTMAKMYFRNTKMRICPGML